MPFRIPTLAILVARVPATLAATLYATLAATLVAAPAAAQPTKPNVAILVYDGVQVIDHAIPYEVFGQFSLNEVYTVAKNPGEITTWMGMRIVPNHTFADAPDPDVLVLPGGDAGDAVDDPEIRAWIRRAAASADHVLTICTGTFFLVGTDLLDGARVTTWYDRQAELASVAPEAEVVGDRIVVDSGKLVSAAGSGIEGSLHVLAKLHGNAWAEVVRLNMEYESVAAAHHVPRVELADLHLPDGIYGAFSWREADLERYEGDRGEWAMEWRFNAATPFDSLRDRFDRALVENDGWVALGEERSENRWEARWSLEEHDGHRWRGQTTLRLVDGLYQLDLRVRRAAEPCESVDPSWSPDGETILFVSNCGGEDLDLWRMDPDGSDLVRLTRTSGDEHGPVLSPDGTRIAYAYREEGEDSEIWTMAPDGSDAAPVTENEHTDWSPTWSPDGRRLAWESLRNGNADIRVVDLETGAESRLTDHPGRDLAPAWTPDGSLVAFQTDRVGRYAIYGISPEDGESRRLVDVPGDAAGPDFSPDGRRLVFSRHEGEGGELWIAPLEGGDPERLTRGDGSDFAPAWSPDGRTIAFIRRGEGGTWAIWTVGVDGTGERRLTFGGGGPEGSGREKPFQP